MGEDGAWNSFRFSSGNRQKPTPDECFSICTQSGIEPNKIPAGQVLTRPTIP